MERITEKSRSPETGYSRLIPNNHLVPPGLPLISMKEAGLSPLVIDFYGKDRENQVNSKVLKMAVAGSGSGGGAPFRFASL